jgi:hypothetical protein
VLADGKAYDEFELELLQQCLATLVEFLQGCEENQRAAFKSDLVDVFNCLLRSMALKSIDPEDVGFLSVS